jgi:hypothetical protein
MSRDAMSNNRFKKRINLALKSADQKEEESMVHITNSNVKLNFQALSLQDRHHTNHKNPFIWNDEYDTAEEEEDGEDSESEGGDSHHDKILTTAFKYARRGRWRTLDKMLQSDSGELICSMQDSSGLSLLSIAVISTPPLETLNLILRLNPSATLEPDKFGVVPIALACMNGASSEVVQTLLEHDNGMGATVPDSDKRVALHHAVEQAARISIKELTEDQSKAVFDSFAFSEDSECSTKLSTSASSTIDLSNDAEVLQLLCEAAPEMVHFASSNGDTPLDVMHIVRGRCKTEAQQTMVEYLYYSILRKTSIELYKKCKKEWEEYGQEDI